MAGRVEGADESPCSAAAMRNATRRMTQLYDDALAPGGLRSTQYAIFEEHYRRADAPPTWGSWPRCSCWTGRHLGTACDQ
jgi:hypothetical protein